MPALLESTLIALQIQHRKNGEQNMLHRQTKEPSREAIKPPSHTHTHTHTCLHEQVTAAVEHALEEAGQAGETQ
eukprot:926921-Pelagomonas_calceolata.AAC.2